MKAKSIIKIIIDVTMVGLFVALLFAYRTGLSFHETMGISIVFFVALHVVLNWKWVTKVSKNLYEKTKLSHKINQLSSNMSSEGNQGHKKFNVKTKTFWMYVLNSGILLGIILIVVTGLLISQVLFPGGLFNEYLFQIHRWTAYTTVGLMGIHLLLHWKYLASMFKAIFTKLRNPIVSQTLSESLAVLMILALVFTGVVSNIQYTYENRFFLQFDDPYLAILLDPNSTAEERRQAGEARRQAQRAEWDLRKTERAQRNETTLAAFKASDAKGDLKTFLSSLFCTVCINFCPLSLLKCAAGTAERQTATDIYYEIVSAGAK